MAVRVRVRIRNPAKNSEIVTRVLVNGGAESDEPIVAITPREAEALGIELDRLEIVEVELASGYAHSYITGDLYPVELLDDEGNVLSRINARLAIDPYLTEPLITDATIDELGIVVISFKRGLWRHRDDPPDTVRRSAT